MGLQIALFIHQVLASTSGYKLAHKCSQVVGVKRLIRAPPTRCNIELAVEVWGSHTQGLTPKWPVCHPIISPSPFLLSTGFEVISLSSQIPRPTTCS
jgi:hypothetical protein